MSQHSTACYQKNPWIQKQWATKSLSPKKNVSKYIKGKKKEGQKSQQEKENLLLKEAEKGTTSRKVQTRQIMRSKSQLQVVVKALKRELLFQDSVAVNVVAVEAEAAEETTEETTEETIEETTEEPKKMEKENTMMTLMSNQANAQEIN